MNNSGTCLISTTFRSYVKIFHISLNSIPMSFKKKEGKIFCKIIFFSKIIFIKEWSEKQTYFKNKTVLCKSISDPTKIYFFTFIYYLINWTYSNQIGWDNIWYLIFDFQYKLFNNQTKFWCWSNIYLPWLIISLL